MTPDEEFAEFAETASPQLRRTAFRLCGNWHTAASGPAACSSASIAIFTALGGLLADLTSTRTALAVAGLVVLTSPLLLPNDH